VDVETSKAVKHGVECQYGGEEMRSLLERRLAILLDSLEIKWKYEHRYFRFKEGKMNYLPDFYLPDHDQYIEAKGVFSEKDKEKIKHFTREREEELVFIKSDTAHFVMTHPNSENPSFGPAHLVECSNCKSHSLVPEYGSYACRVCGNHNGDSDILKYNFMDGSRNYHQSRPDLKLINQEVINSWLEEVRG